MGHTRCETWWVLGGCGKNGAMKKVKGRIHSLESFGTQDGPGIRYVIFLQGCPGRCLYCQNPDTWPCKGGALMSARDVFERVKKCIPYMQASGGGITISGGEPLLQPDFLIELFKLCREKSVHTCIDTSAFFTRKKRSRKIDMLIELTDLFMVDVKATDEKTHRKLTGRDLKESLSFIDMLEKKKIPYWVRYVLVTGKNDSVREIRRLKNMLADKAMCEKIEFLPYHTLGEHKWRLLGIKYPLKGLRSATKRDIKKAYRIFCDSSE